MAFGRSARHGVTEPGLDLSERLLPYGDTAESDDAVTVENGPQVEAKQSGGVRLVVADDLPAMRTMLNLAASLADGITLVGEARDGGEALELCQNLRPDVILLDVDMPGMDGITAVPLIRSTSPDVKIAMYSNDRTAEQASLEAGAHAYFIKLDIPPGELLTRLIELAGDQAHIEAGR